MKEFLSEVVVGWKNEMGSIREQNARFGDKPPWNSANLDRIGTV